ncbi:MAG TPA: 2-phospho-L-lactate transferase CofD family protein, partial [Legionellaceae bacterium]|nr:2-phospho-L-lactate transferase CofD family protein [Legionellaceae bacterium]
QIVFTTEDNDYFEGEDMLDIRSTTPDTVRNMKLKPEIDAFPKAIEAIKKAKLIILSCGSVHGSVLCNFLPTGMKEAIQETAAKVYWVTNLTSTKNETDEATPISMVRLAEKYTGIQISGLIVPQMTREQFNEEYPEVADRYKKRESSHFLGWSEDQLDEAHSAGIEIVKHDAIKIIRINLPEDAYKLIVRHDPVKLAQSLKSIV